MSRSTPVCRRRACGLPRQRWQHLCSECWSRLPPALAREIVAERKARHFAAVDQLYARAIAILDGKAPDPRTTAIAAITGDREDAAAE